MSKKTSECDRYERIRRLEREAEAEKKKVSELSKKKGGKARGKDEGFRAYKFKSIDYDDYDD